MSKTDVSLRGNDYPIYDWAKAAPYFRPTDPVATRPAVTVKYVTKPKKEVRPYFSYKHMAWAFVIFQVFYWRGEEALVFILTIVMIICHIVCYSFYFWLDDWLMVLRTSWTIVQILLIVHCLLLVLLYGLQLMFGDIE
ncbi:hypothetical protein FRC07_003039 [Ceratobasidium sp. 392]|nr:hypothetical protein FRC07_003039 [Ceratobasidium sp. 392]